MISERAKQTFNEMVCRAVRSSPLIPAGGSCEIAPCLANSTSSTLKVVAFTVLTYSFRLTLLIHFSDDEVTRAHFGKGAVAAEGGFGNSDFVDAICESGNICCGNLNRDLLRFFPHVGMSTPNIVDVRCVAYLGRLGSGYIENFELVTSSGPRFELTLCVNDYSDLDFEGEFENVETGGLEMF